jgi:3',5'-nucleoside bisphosphate phosphatase
MKKLNQITFISVFIIPLFSIQLTAQSISRKEIKIPDILGFKTLKCDFHTHTIFSDGDVWPTIRVSEAWKEGLDAIAITDHLEYRPHQGDLVKNFNRSYEIAKEYSKDFGIIVIKGIEITQAMPPGHFNLLFIKDANLLDTLDYNAAIKEGKKQGAFIQWNHPFWKNPVFPRVNSKVEWFKQQKELYENGLLDGIEIVNERDYYPDAFRWCKEKNLTILGNSDIHLPTGYFYDFSKDQHRTMTLVFAENKSEEAIKEALTAHRTVVFFSDTLIGSDRFLREIFNKSITINEAKLEKEKGKLFYIMITNNSDIPYSLIANGIDKDFEFSTDVYLPARSTARLGIKPKKDDFVGMRNLILPYKVKNLITEPFESLKMEISVGIEMK